MMKSTLAFVAAVVVALSSAACRHQRAEGPAERAGRKIDNAAEDTKDAVKDTKRDVKRDLDR